MAGLSWAKDNKLLNVTENNHQWGRQSSSLAVVPYDHKAWWASIEDANGISIANYLTNTFQFTATFLFRFTFGRPTHNIQQVI